MPFLVHGTGALSLTPDGQSVLETKRACASAERCERSLTPDGQSALETGVSMMMSAVGTRGERGGSRATGDFAPAFKSDALWWARPAICSTVRSAG